MNRIKLTLRDGEFEYIDMDSIISVGKGPQDGTGLYFPGLEEPGCFVVKESIDEVLALEKKGKNE